MELNLILLLLYMYCVCRRSNGERGLLSLTSDGGEGTQGPATAATEIESMCSTLEDDGHRVSSYPSDRYHGTSKVHVQCIGTCTCTQFAAPLQTVARPSALGPPAPAALCASAIHHLIQQRREQQKVQKPED